jgi:MOSC domain-containing protein YiiM
MVTKQRHPKLPSDTARGRLESVNVALPEDVPYRGRPIRTGINKMPVRGPVMVRRLNLDGDAQAELTVHGGPDKAVYVYASENYALWREELGRDLPFGQFGENLTTSGFLEEDIHVGDLLTVGQAVLRVTQPRFPCFKLGNKMGDMRFIVRFLESGRSGFYCRVLEEGLIESGQGITLERGERPGPSIGAVVDRVRRRGR